MSAVFDTFGDSGDAYGPRRSRVFSRIAHLFPPVALAVLALVVAEDITGGFLPTWAEWITVVVYGSVFLIAMLHRELARICVRCMRDVPADASAQAARKKPLLWVDHHVGLTLLVVAALIVISVVARRVLGLPAGPSWVSLPLDAVLIVQVVGIWTHHRLRPWCPFCRPWDDGHGPRERVPNPDPAGVKTS